MLPSSPTSLLKLWLGETRMAQGGTSLRGVLPRRRPSPSLWTIEQELAEECSEFGTRVQGQYG